jgi:hypothetical protein
VGLSNSLASVSAFSFFLSRAVCSSLHFMQLLMNLPLVAGKRPRRLASRSLETSSRRQMRGFGNTSSRFLKTVLHVSLKIFCYFDDHVWSFKMMTFRKRWPCLSATVFIALAAGRLAFANRITFASEP